MSGRSIRDLESWLAGLGLGQYASILAENDVDGEVLTELTDADLEKLGFSLGHRRRLLKAIRELEAPPEDAPAAAAPAPMGEAERRQLTVMFSDLVGSTALSARLDPEDMRDVINAYQTACTEAIERFDGHVAKYMGDGVLAYFGYPQAHEDDAERAVRAGLALVGAVGALEAEGLPLQARVGIHTGTCVVGDLIGKGAAQEQAVVGEVPNLAARLQGIAPPDGIAISGATQRLVGPVVEYADLGEHALKGFDEPIQAWQVLGESEIESRFAARSMAGLTPLVGREQEIGLLTERWQQARSGDGQAVLLIGEAGIGKSRIIQALLDRLSGEGVLRIRYFCSPFAINSALFPVIEQLTRAAGFTRGDSAETKLAKLEALLAATGEPLAEVVPLLAPLCSVPTGGRYPTPDISPQRQRELTFLSLLRQLEWHAARQPVLLLVEDGHWMDPTTAELFQLAVDRIAGMRVFLVITGRPELDPPWAGYPHVTLLRLNRLGRAQGAELLERITGGKPLPEIVREQIIAKTDGIPLFVEELTKTILESGLLRDTGDRWVLDGPLPPLAIPATLHDSLMARLDRLAPVKEVAQLGAAIGREFGFELIAAIATMREAELAKALDQLVAAELVFRRGAPPSCQYNFKHALVQDVAYGSLLRGRRQALHRRIAETLERRFPEIATQQPELLARHYSEANMPAKAVGYRLAAAERAAARSANAEALVHLRRGLDAVTALPDSAENMRTELALLAQLAVVLRITQGYGSDELIRALMRARELCERVGTTQQMFQVLFGLWTSSAGRGDWAGCQRLAEECLTLAGREAEVGFTVEAYRLLGTTAVYRAEFESARQYLERALELFDAERDREHARLYGYDPWCICAGYLSWVLWHLGLPDQATRLSEESIAAAERTGLAANLSITLGWAVFLRSCMGDIEALAPLADRLIDYATTMGFPQFLALGRIGRGVQLTRTGEPESGIALIRQGSVEFAAAWGGFFIPYWRVFLARALGRAGDIEAGLEALFQAEAQVAMTGERLSLAEIHRVRGDLLRWSRRLEEADASYRRALEVARAQAARSLELRAAISLTELGAVPATGLLAEVFRTFAEGHGTPDLQAAAALLSY